MIQAILPQDAAKMLAQGEAILIDVREADEFNDEHIAYANSLPLSRLQASVQKIKSFFSGRDEQSPHIAQARHGLKRYAGDALGGDVFQCRRSAMSVLATITSFRITAVKATFGFFPRLIKFL